MSQYNVLLIGFQRTAGATLIRVWLSARKPGFNPQWLLSLTVLWRCSHLSLNKCLYHVSVSLLCVLYRFTFMLFLCLGFVLFEWLSAVYVVFPAWTLSFNSIVEFFNYIRSQKIRKWIDKCIDILAARILALKGGLLLWKQLWFHYECFWKKVGHTQGKVASTLLDKNVTIDLETDYTTLRRIKI